MYAQQFLEGEKYVTISLVCSIIAGIRKHIYAIRNMSENSEYLNKMLDEVIQCFEENWGKGIKDTEFDEQNNTGDRNRHKGFRKLHMVSSFLDPRTKGLVEFGPEDKLKIIAEVTLRATKIAKEMRNETPKRSEVPQISSEKAASAVDGNAAASSRVDKYKLMFSFITSSPAEDEQEIDEDISVAAAVHCEISCYRSYPVLNRVIETEEDPETGLPHSTISDPLKWWKQHSEKLPILARLARQTLCVPASSASCERLFSTAGLTIAKDRSRLTPENASDLVFLKGSWNKINKYVAKRKAADAELIDD
jgi:hypothetical protein